MEAVTSRMARCTNHEEPLGSKLRDFDLLQHKCAQCGDWFNVKTGAARYCKDTCRMKAHRGRKDG